MARHSTRVWATSAKRAESPPPAHEGVARRLAFECRRRDTPDSDNNLRIGGACTWDGCANRESDDLLLSASLALAVLLPFSVPNTV